MAKQNSRKGQSKNSSADIDASVGNSSELDRESARENANGPDYGGRTAADVGGEFGDAPTRSSRDKEIDESATSKDWSEDQSGRSER